MKASDTDRRDPASVAPSPAIALAAAAGDDVVSRDRFIVRAALTGDSVSEIAEHLGLSRQQVYAILEIQRQAPAPDSAGGLWAPELTDAWHATEAALEAMTGAEDFERLAHVLLLDIDESARPLGGAGDRGRDAVSDLRSGDGSVFSISLERQWTRKIRREVRRILDFEYAPAFVYGITNRRTTRHAEEELEEWAASLGIRLRVLGQRWLVSKLMHPDYAQLRRDFLHLPDPRPSVFLTSSRYRELLNGRPATQGLSIPRVGGVNLVEDVRRKLDELGWLILQGPGGIGKTRLLVDAADRAEEGETWRFLDDLMPIRNESLGELGGGSKLVVVVDNAHRRADLERLLGLLERRKPRPQVVFVTRSGRTGGIERAAGHAWLGAPTAEQTVQIGRLPDREIVKLVQASPFELEYEGVVRAVVRLAEGNPLIAILAAGVAQDGRSIAELSRAEVLQQYVGALLASLTERSSESDQLRELLAIVAALGSFDRSDAELVHTTADLLGCGRRGVLRWLDELADLGLVVEDAIGVARIKPDLLAEHVLVSTFFSPRWRPALPYHDVLEAFGDRHLVTLCTALGQVPARDLDPDNRELQALRGRLQPFLFGEDSSVAARLLEQLLPGAEMLVLDDFGHVIERIEQDPSALQTAAGTILVRATQRLTLDVAAGWELLLRLTAATDDVEINAAAWMAFHSIYERVPMRTSPHDAHVLAMVQQVIADRTRAYVRRIRTPGQSRAAAMAGQALLTTTFELSQLAVDNARQLQMTAYALPASPYTQTALEVGVDTITTTFLDLEDPERLKGIEAATELARRVAGFSGPFGVELTDETRQLADHALALLDRFLHETMPQLSLPVQAEALGYLLARREWHGRTSRGESAPPARPALPARSTDLEEYLLLVHPKDIELGSSTAGWQERQQAKHAQAIQIADRLVADQNWRTRLTTWEQWQEQANAVADRPARSPWQMTVLTEAAKRDPIRGIALVDYLAGLDSELRLHLGGAIHELVASGVDHHTLDRWLAAGENFRAVVASAIGDIESQLAEGTFRRLATDSSAVVRRGVLNGLRFGRSTTPWKLELGVSVAESLSDVQALHLVFMVAEHDGLEMPPELIPKAGKALLATAAADRVDEHDLIEVIKRIQPTEPGIALAWIWRRIDWLDGVKSRAAWTIDVMPGQLSTLVQQHSTASDLHNALQRYEAADPGSLAEAAIAELIGWIDPSAKEITDWVVRHFNHPEFEGKAHRLLRLPLTAEQARVRAVALLTALDDPRIVDQFAFNMLPSMWRGSRIPHLESVLATIQRWATTETSPAFDRAIGNAAADLRRQIDAERERERREEELDFLT